jgi:hypothetical protein
MVIISGNFLNKVLRDGLTKPPLMFTVSGWIIAEENEL